MIFFDGDGMDDVVTDAPATDGGDAMGGDDSAVSAPESAEETATPEAPAVE